MQTFVISLQTAAERRDHIKTCFSEYDISFQFFAAIEPAEAAQEIRFIDQKTCQLNTGRLLSPAELACFASHKRLWRLCVAMNEPIAILEDDVTPTRHFIAGRHLLPAWCDRYGYVRLSTGQARSQTVLEESGSFSLAVLTRCPYSTAAYAISPHAAKLLLSACETVRGPVDVFIKQFWEHGQSIHRVEPDMFSLSSHAWQPTIADRESPNPSQIARAHRQIHKWRHFARRALFNWSHRPATLPTIGRQTTPIG